MTAQHPATLPHNLDAERAVLGAILLDGRRYLEAGDLLAPEDFYRDAHQVIFRALLTLGKRGAAIELVTLADVLGAAGLERCGGPAYISKLLDGLPRSANLPHYAAIVAHHAKGRRLHAVARELMAGVLEADADLDAVQEAAEAGLREAHAKGAGDGFVSGPVVADRMLARIESWEKGTLAGVTTGFASLNDSILGLHRTELIVIAGRPGMGKSAIAGQIAATVAIDAGLPVAWFTLEMEVEEVSTRIAATRAGVPFRKLMRGHANESELWQIEQQAKAIAESPLYIDDAFDRNVAQIRRGCRLLHAKAPLGLVVVDYLTLMDGVPGERHDTRTREVGSWAKRLKGLAKELRVPVVLCCQLNREVEKGPVKAAVRPRLKDLRDSGEIEQAANTVLFVHHDRPDEMGVQSWPAEVIVAKQRHGPVGPVSMRFNGPLVRFEEA
jgi:replicative DNA helicase